MMHSTRWLPRLECTLTHSPASSARGLPPAWDMLGRGRQEEPSDPRPRCGMPPLSASDAWEIWGPDPCGGFPGASGSLPDIPACCLPACPMGSPA